VMERSLAIRSSLTEGSLRVTSQFSTYLTVFVTCLLPAVSPSG
jgi:hypothetical protein